MFHLLILPKKAMENKTNLEAARTKLRVTFKNKRVYLIIWLNLTYMVLCPIFLMSEKLGSGHFVPHPLLGFVYAFVWIANCSSMIFNVHRIQKIRLQFFERLEKRFGSDKIDRSLCLASITSLMMMSFLNMIGFGNPSNDSIITDFAFGHSLIIITIILLGRTSAFIWFVITLSTLFYVSFSRGMDYKYHYLTPKEVKIYEVNLLNNEPNALLRQFELKKAGLNPPNVSRYFNVWLVMIIQAFMVAFFFNGISRDMLKVIPEVEDDIDKAIEDQYEIVRLNALLQEEKTKGELHFLKAQINPHLLYNTLSHFHAKAEDFDSDLAKGILKLSEIMRYSLTDSTEDKVSLEEEIAQIRNLIDLHQLRYGGKLFINLEVNIQNNEAQIYPLLLLSFVENALKHGQLQDRFCPVEISVKTENNTLLFSTKNRKNKAAMVISTNIGLSNIRKRLEILYPQKHTLNITNEDENYDCYLTLKLGTDHEKDSVYHS
jgi:two-component system, LytTR family, sensor kinase